MKSNNLRERIESLKKYGSPPTPHMLLELLDRVEALEKNQKYVYRHIPLK